MPEVGFATLLIISMKGYIISVTGPSWFVNALLCDNRFGFNFNQYVRTDQAADFHHRGDGANFAEELAVRLADFSPMVNIDDINAGAHNMAKVSSLQIASAV
jgi:hypothetical protein